MLDAAEWDLDNPEHLYCHNTYNNLLKYRTHYWFALLDKAITFFLNYSAYEKDNRFSSVFYQKRAGLAWYKFWYYDLPHKKTVYFDSSAYESSDSE